jgi:hypothetical protein
MPNHRRTGLPPASRQRLCILLLLVSAELFAGGVALLARHSDAHGGTLLGYSPLRLAVAVPLLAAGLLSAWWANAVRSGRGWQRRAHQLITTTNSRNRLITILLMAAGLTWVGVFLPGYRLGPAAAYLDHLRPALAVVLLAAVEGIGFFLLESTDFSRAGLRRLWRRPRSAIRTWALLLLGMALTWAVIATTRAGLEPRGEDYWYEAGVPVLGLSVFIAIALGGLTAVIEQRTGGRRRSITTDVLLFLAIWVVSAAAWMWTPAPNGWFNPGPFPPTDQTYPFSDAAKYDVQAQFALIGQGLNNGDPSPRPAYPAFLVLVHLLTGQGYEANMNLQAFVLGLFPACLYLLGNLLFGRAAGVAAAALAMLRGVDAIAATDLLNLANAKQMLPDFPAALGLAVTLIVCILWFRSPRALRHPLLAGGALAFSVYLRPTVLGIMPAIVLLAFAAYGGLPKKWLAAGLAVLLCGYLAAALPWEAREQLRSGKHQYPSSLIKILSVLRSRYPGAEAEPRADPQPQPAPQTPSSNQSTQDGQRFQGEMQDPQPPRSDFELPSTRLDAAVLANHFLHNLATSALILPTTPMLDDLHGTVRVQNSYWRFRWSGTLSTAQGMLLGASLGFVALGLVAAWRGSAATGLLPLGALLGYHLANAAGRTSGGRYIVPVDWIVLLYFSIGLVHATAWPLRRLGLLRARASGPARAVAAAAPAVHAVRPLLWPAVGLLALGALLTIPDFAFAATFDRLTEKQRRDIITAVLAEQEAGIDAKYVGSLLRRGGTSASGRILYPRFTAGNALGEYFFESSRTTIEYPLLAFSMIGPGGLSNVRLAGPLAVDVAHYSDAIVLGCQHERRLEAALIILQEEPARILTSHPLPPPECPFPERVCDSNGNCR